MIFNKLIRDRIPEIIENNGQIPVVEVLDDREYSRKLNEKLLEECNEAINASDKNSKIEEMADILEVLHALADVLETDMNEVEKVRLNKQKQRGAFKNKLLLKSTHSPDKTPSDNFN